MFGYETRGLEIFMLIRCIIYKLFYFYLFPYIFIVWSNMWHLNKLIIILLYFQLTISFFPWVY